MLFFSCSEKKSGTDNSVEEKEDSNKVTKVNSGDEVFYLITQNWEVEDAESPTTKDLYGKTEDSIQNFPGLCFMTDSTIVENPRGKIRFGTFKMSGNTINAKYNDGGSASYAISRALPEALQLKRTENGKLTTLFLVGDGLRFVNPKDNPYHESYNQWRIRPASSESDDALTARVKQCVLFYQAYLRANIFLNAKAISFEGIPCCLNWYSGGISIQSEKKLDKKWAACFYSKTDAFKARQIFEDALVKKHKWVTGDGNWVKQTIPVLRSVHDSL